MALTKVDPKGTTTLSSGWDAFNDLIDDLASEDSGKGASQIGILDTAGNLDATNVEDAIAEIYTDVASSRTIADFLDEDPATTTGLTWGFKGGKLLSTNLSGLTTITNVSAGTISLTDDATNYIAIQRDGTVVRNTTAYGEYNLPVRIVVCADGVQTSSTDKRSFLHNIHTPYELGIQHWRFHRPQFSWKDADEIYIHAGGYWAVKGGYMGYVATANITFQFGSAGSNAGSSDLNNNDWHYIYLDYSVIAAGATNGKHFVPLTAAMFYNHTTEPTWDNTYHGWYNGNDRCIAAFRTGASANVLEFFHEGDLILWADQIAIITATDIDTTWTDETMIIPVFSKRALVRFTSQYVDGASVLYWRTNGQSGTTGHQTCTVGAAATTENQTVTVYTDASGMIEIKHSDSNANTTAIQQNGYYFGDGL